MALKLSNLESFRALKASNLATGTIWSIPTFYFEGGKNPSWFTIYSFDLMHRMWIEPKSWLIDEWYFYIYLPLQIAEPKASYKKSPSWLKKENVYDLLQYKSFLKEFTCSSSFIWVWLKTSFHEGLCCFWHLHWNLRMNLIKSNLEHCSFRSTWQDRTG